jgi:AAA15 family ATPase/GTPase
MLIEFSAENFRSIKDEVRLSLVAGAGKELYDTNVTAPQMPKGVKNIPLLRSAALYGPNAGGKSNIIKALATMQRIVMTSSQQLEDLPVVPFRLSRSTIDKPSVFEVIILSEGVRYQYGFSATSEAVHDEWLFAFPKGRTQTWFERSRNLETGDYEYTFGDKLTGDKDVWRRATRPNALFLSTAIQLNSQQLQPVFNWFSNRLRIAGVGGWSPHFSMQWCKDDRKEKVLDFLKAADFAISDVRVAEEDFSSDTFPPNLPSHVKKFLEYEFKDKKRFRLITSHTSDTGDMVELDLDEESDGTRKMFSFAGPWLDSLEKGHVLFIDELHDNLHPLLVKFLVELFHNSDTNSNFAQLIFSTHETSILSQDVFRRDQIWFCDRAKTQNTKLYPLTEFSPRKGVENLERAYLSGRYGALPFLRAITQNFGG